MNDEKRLFRKLQKYHVLIFVSASLAALIGVLVFRNNPNYQLSILTALVVGYLAWALNYHRLDKSLNFEVVLEYILTALLVLIIFYGVLI